METRTLAGERWLLFARREAATLIKLQALVSLGRGHVLAELAVGPAELSEQMEALGLDVDAEAFAALLSAALDDREGVEVEIPEEEVTDETKVAVAVTYKFSDTISRKGYFELPVAATVVPEVVVQLLKDLHATPHRAVLSSGQRRKLEEKKAAAPVFLEKPASVSVEALFKPKPAEQPTATITSSSSLQAEEEPQPSQQQRLKRKLVPTGAVRRKASKGAKLVKR